MILDRKPTMHVVEIVETWLSTNLGRTWGMFRVVDKAEYLGMWLGPGAGYDVQWESVVGKLSERAHEIGNANASPTLSAKAFNT